MVRFLKLHAQINPRHRIQGVLQILIQWQPEMHAGPRLAQAHACIETELMHGTFIETSALFREQGAAGDAAHDTEAFGFIARLRAIADKQFNIVSEVIFAGVNEQRGAAAQFEGKAGWTPITIIGQRHDGKIVRQESLEAIILGVYAGKHAQKFVFRRNRNAQANLGGKRAGAILDFKPEIRIAEKTLGFTVVVEVGFRFRTAVYERQLAHEQNFPRHGQTQRPKNDPARIRASERAGIIILKIRLQNFEAERAFVQGE